jgi:ATP-dependent DNA ligase
VCRLGFAVEAKYDGQRGIAILDDGVVTLLSRNGAGARDRRSAP